MGIIDSAHGMVIKRFVPLDYKEDQILSSVKDEATSGAGHP